MTDLSLHRAVLNEDVDEVELLLHAGADPDKLNENGNTPLHVCKNLEIVTLLIQTGANPKYQEQLGKYTSPFLVS
jgi:ankyrin repeat protein